MNVMERVCKPRRRFQPATADLEDRVVMSGMLAAPDVTGASVQQRAVSFVNRRLDYRTPDGTHVIVTLYGAGSLAGSSINPDGSLNLVYGGTNAGTRIFGFAHGGTGFAPLRSVLPAGVSPQNLTGLGMTPIGALRMTPFTLVSGGQINVTAGINIFQIYAIEGNTQVNLRELPASIVKGQGNGGTASAGDNGVTLTYSPGPGGSQILTKVSGQFTAGTNLAYANPTTAGVPNSGAPSAPPGLDIKVQHVYGPARASTSLANLAGSALIDVQGNVQYYKGVDARGLVFNDLGNLNLVKLRSLVDSTIIGEPFGHPAIDNEQNVLIVSTARVTGSNHDVTVVPGLQPIGPLSQP